MMKKLLTIFCMLVFFCSCMDEKKNENPDVENYETVEPKDELGTSPMDQPIESREIDSEEETTENTESRNPEEEIASISNAIYINTDHQNDTGCSCYCIEVVASGSSELCIVENEMYIKARFVKEANKLNVYYVGKSSNNTDNELPWNKFGKNTPIAVLNPTGDGNFKLDWKGFTIDGEIAVDYAIYGKKTLEGTYKKK